MAGELQDLMDALVTAQKAITPPAGAKDIANVTEEPLGQIVVFPAFVNVERETVLTTASHGASTRYATHLIDMHLVFSPADRKYAVRQMRPWVEAVLDALDKHTLFTDAFASEITTVDFEPLEWPPNSNIFYRAANFELQTRVLRA
jgi:hypothetical protein